MKVLEEIDIDLTKEKILKEPPLSKWGKNRKSFEKIEKLLEKLLKKLSYKISPKAIYDIKEREKTDIENYSPTKPVLKSEYLAFVIVTLGKREKTEGSSLETLVIDAIENFALNQATRKVVDLIEENKKEGLKMSRLLSPGSGRIGWEIENQELIFKNLDASKFGVSLKPSFAIDPPKSISFLIGLGEDITQPENVFSCEGCERVECSYRIE